MITDLEHRILCDACETETLQGLRLRAALEVAADTGLPWTVLVIAVRSQLDTRAWTLGRTSIRAAPAIDALRALLQEHDPRGLLFGVGSDLEAELARTRLRAKLPP